MIGRPREGDLVVAENVISIVRERLSGVREGLRCMHPRCPTMDGPSPCCEAYEIDQILDVIQNYEDGRG